VPKFNRKPIVPNVAADKAVDHTKPFACHGMEFSPPNGGNQCISDCPFCGKEGRFFLDSTTGMCQCKVCGFKGNVYTFFQEYHKACKGQRVKLDKLASDRKLLPQSLDKWGVAMGLLKREWVVPGYNQDGKVCQLYRYVLDKQSGKKRLMCSTGLDHQIYGVHLFDKKKPKVYVCEGIWDAIALWEMLKSVRLSGDRMVRTSNETTSMLQDVNVIGIPGSQVFKAKWLELLAGREVVFFNHNDHPRLNERTGEYSEPSSLGGIKRVVELMQKESKYAKSVKYLQWGEEGYTKNHPSGYDVRDALTEPEDFAGRVERLKGLLDTVRDIPPEWAGNSKKPTGSGVTPLQMDLLECTSFKQVEDSFKKSMTWMEGMSRTLSCMLAVTLSTKSAGSQLWMRFIGPPSSGKTELAEAISTCTEYVRQVSNMRGFMSGYKTDKEGMEDHSLVDAIKDMTMVTKDGDTLLQSPNLGQILGEGRDLYDGRTSAHYRHGLNRDYQAVRFTWILCGTESLRQMDGNELGERFIDCVIMSSVPREIEKKIGLSLVEKMFDGMAQQSVGGKSDSISAPDIVESRKLTGGYIKYLRENASRLFSELAQGKEKSRKAFDKCQQLGMFVSYMRARPSKTQIEKAQRELSYRLSQQFGRLATCLAVVLNKKFLDKETMRRVSRVALDTARGRVYNLATLLIENEDNPLTELAMSSILGEKPQAFQDLLLFLRKIGAIETYEHSVGKVVRKRWRLTDTVRELYEVVHGGLES
jgi:hypothetical protein